MISIIVSNTVYGIEIRKRFIKYLSKFQPYDIIDQNLFLPDKNPKQYLKSTFFIHRLVYAKTQKINV